MPLINNVTADNPPITILNDGHHYDAVVIQALTNNVVVQVGGNAAADSGETVFGNSSATFTNLKSQKVSVFAAVPTEVSFREEVD